MLLLLRRAPGSVPRPSTGSMPPVAPPLPVVRSNRFPNGAQTVDQGPFPLPRISPYPDLNAGWVYPTPVVSPRDGRQSAGVAASQVDFALKQAAPVTGLRWNGLLLGMPVATVAYRAPGASTYVQVVGATLVWASSSFPLQYAGLRVQANGRMVELSVVDLANAPSGMGGVWRVQMVGSTKAVYLVDTTDPQASPVRVRTTTGTKAARLKT